MIPMDPQLVWYRNTQEPQGFTLTDTDPVSGAAVPVDLTGYSFRMQLRLYPGAAGDALLTLGMAAKGAAGFYIDDAAAGQFTLTPPGYAQLAALPPPSDVPSGDTSFAQDCLLIAPDGTRELFWAGPIDIRSGVTR